MISTTTFDLKQTSVRSLEWVFKTFRQDLEALPDEAFARCLGGKARTIADLVHEVVLVNDRERLTITGGDLFPFPDGWVTAPEELKSKPAVMESFNASAERFLEAVQGLSDELLIEPVETEDGPTTRFQQCRFIVWHTGYHSGQLNFIQTLLGDDQWHWT